MNILVVVGSTRPGCLTGHSAQVIKDYLDKKLLSSELLHLKDIRVPYIGAPFEVEDQQLLQKKVSSASGLIICTPEYNGCFSSALMAFIENMGYPAAFAHKPLALLGVASGSIGAVKALEHLRGVCSHSGGLVLPYSVSIAHIHRYFDDSGQLQDEKIRHQILSVPKSLENYLSALKEAEATS